MNLQYISDSAGRTTGVYIPINEWNEFKTKYKVIEGNEIDVPKWQIDTVKERVTSYLENTSSALDFDSALNDIEKEL